MKAQKKQEAITTFNHDIFRAIDSLNTEESRANITQINKHFQRHEILKTREFDLSLNTSYLKSLVSEGYLATEQVRSYIVYVLTEKANEELSPKVETPKESEQLVIEEAIHEDKEDELPSDTMEDSEQHQNEEVIMATTEDSIKCPECGYICLKSWNESECINCNATLPVESFEDIQVQCPNPTCNYTCFASWGECPICHTSLSSIMGWKGIKKAPKREETSKKPQPQIIPTSEYLNVYCVACGNQIKPTSKKIPQSSHICSKCKEDSTSKKILIEYCPTCGKPTEPKERFCIHCYRSFCHPSKKFKNKSVEELYHLSVKYRNNYQFSRFFAVILVLVALLIANLMLDFNYADEIQFDIWDYFIPAVFFAPVFLYNFIRYNQVRKERIARDPHYRIKLGVIHHEKHKAVDAVKEKYNQYRKRYVRELKQIQKLYDKIVAINKRRPFYKIISIVLITVSFGFIFLVYSLFLIFLIVGLCFLYLYIRKKPAQHIDEMIQLGKRLVEDEFRIFVFLVIRQLYYLQTVKERDKKR